jgi:hypothetical protein
MIRAPTLRAMKVVPCHKPGGSQRSGFWCPSLIPKSRLAATVRRPAIVRRYIRSTGTNSEGAVPSVFQEHDYNHIFEKVRQWNNLTKARIAAPFTKRYLSQPSPPACTRYYSNFDSHTNVLVRRLAEANTQGVSSSSIGVIIRIRQVSRCLQVRTQRHLATLKAGVSREVEFRLFDPLRVSPRDLTCYHRASQPWQSRRWTTRLNLVGRG